jgi:hypothetical protein
VKMLSEETPSRAVGRTAPRVVEAPPTLTIALLEGSVHAEVVPHPDGEVFAVEVGQTRVAAHGTSFTVTREGDRVVVDVVHGSVAVGPTGHPGSTHRWLLVGPDKASFSLDGATEATWFGEPPAAEANPGDAVPDVAGADTGEPRADLGAEASPSPPPRGSRRDAGVRVHARALNKVAADPVAAILARLGACYERQVSSFGVRFSIRSSLTLTVLPNGTVREGLFDPPLSPTLMTCARDVIAASRFPQESATTIVRVPVELKPSR